MTVLNGGTGGLGTVELVELVEPEPAVLDEGGLAGLGRSLPYTLSGRVKSTMPEILTGILA